MGLVRRAACSARRGGRFFAAERRLGRFPRVLPAQASRGGRQRVDRLVRRHVRHVQRRQRRVPDVQRSRRGLRLRRVQHGHRQLRLQRRLARVPRHQHALCHSVRHDHGQRVRVARARVQRDFESGVHHARRDRASRARRLCLLRPAGALLDQRFRGHRLARVRRPGALQPPECRVRRLERARVLARGHYGLRPRHQLLGQPAQLPVRDLFFLLLLLLLLCWKFRCLRAAAAVRRLPVLLGHVQRFGGAPRHERRDAERWDKKLRRDGDAVPHARVHVHGLRRYAVLFPLGVRLHVEPQHARYQPVRHLAR